MTVSVPGLPDVKVCITHSTKASCGTSSPINLIPANHMSPRRWGIEGGEEKLVMAVNGNDSSLYLGRSLGPSSLLGGSCVAY